MEGELFGLGRTWWMAILIIIGSTLLFGFGKIDIESWKSIIEWIFAAAAGKSALGAIGGAIAKKSNGGQ